MTEQLVASRRREIGGDSARSLLLTVLGEFVHPRHASVWTATLLDALAAVGVEEKSARQALTRTASEGLLVSSRHGRRVPWTVVHRMAHVNTLRRRRRELGGRTVVAAGPAADTQVPCPVWRQLVSPLSHRAIGRNPALPAPSVLALQRRGGTCADTLARRCARHGQWIATLRPRRGRGV